MIQNQVANWEAMSPEAQQRIMDAARNAGYLKNSGKQQFFMPNWMRGNMSALEEQRGQRIRPQTMSINDWQSVTPLSNLKGEAYRQYQDFSNLVRDESERANFQRYAKEHNMMPQPGAMARDPRQSQPQPMPRPIAQPQRPQPAPNFVSGPQQPAPNWGRQPFNFNGMQIQPWKLPRPVTGGAHPPEGIAYMGGNPNFNESTGQWGGGVKGFQQMVQAVQPGVGIGTSLQNPQRGFQLINALGR